MTFCPRRDLPCNSQKPMVPLYLGPSSDVGLDLLGETLVFSPRSRARTRMAGCSTTVRPPGRPTADLGWGIAACDTCPLDMSGLDIG